MDKWLVRFCQGLLNFALLTFQEWTKSACLRHLLERRHGSSCMELQKAMCLFGNRHINLEGRPWPGCAAGRLWRATIPSRAITEAAQNAAVLRQ